MVNILQDYIHEYDFPYHDYLKNYKEDLIQKYILYKNYKKDATDLRLPQNYPISTFLIPKINKIIKKYYFAGKPLIDYGLRIYVQNDQQNMSFYHNHANPRTPSSIAGVFYLDPPQDGGELIFLQNPDDKNPNTKEIVIKPKKDKLYLFPYWIYHKPLPQKDKDYRICFNFAHGSFIRPIHKPSLIPW